LAGDGVTANDHTAANYYRMAAEQGYGKARFVLAVMYLQGRGVPKDLIEAYRWFLLAEMALPAGYMREQAAGGSRLVKQQLTPEQIDAVHQFAQEHRSSK
jgi:TPR repeat protein